MMLGHPKLTTQASDLTVMANKWGINHIWAKPYDWATVTWYSSACHSVL